MLIALAKNQIVQNLISKFVGMSAKQGVWGHQRSWNMHRPTRRCFLWFQKQVANIIQTSLGPWLTSLYPFYLYPFCRTWDGTKNLQTSYVSNYLIQTNMKIHHHRYHSTLTLLSNWHFQVSYYCEPPKKVIQRFPHGATKQTHRWFRWNFST